MRGPCNTLVKQDCTNTRSPMRKHFGRTIRCESKIFDNCSPKWEKEEQGKTCICFRQARQSCAKPNRLGASLGRPILVSDRRARVALNQID